MSTIYFTSDWHFSHANIIKFCPEFRDITPDKMNDYLIKIWNSTVTPDDVVYNLGDVSFACHKDEVIDVLSQLNGKHHLIVGNHDNIITQHREQFLAMKKQDGNPLLSSIKDYAKLRLKDSGHTLILSHYPMIEWDGCHKGWYHLYGHLHDRLAKVQGRALNVGFDLHGRLLSLADIDEFLAPLPKVSHFGRDDDMAVNADIDHNAKLIKDELLRLNDLTV